MFTCPRTFASDVVLADSSKDWLTADSAWEKATGDYNTLVSGGLADLVRSFYGHDRALVTELELAEVKLDAAGYAPNGQYFGRGARLFELAIAVPVESTMPGYYRYFYVRAASIPQIRAALRKLFVNARIIRT